MIKVFSQLKYRKLRMGRGYDNDVFQGCLVKFAELVVQIFVHSNWQNVLSSIIFIGLRTGIYTLYYCSFINLYCTIRMINYQK